ncbi:MAG: HEAT repeat domain-containing protein [Planctomycetota bacterium]
MVRAELNAEELLIGLASGVPAKQYEAYLSLGNLRRNEEVDAVVAALRKGHRGARSYVGRYLADLGTPHALAHLWTLARDAHDGERSEHDRDRAVYLEIFARIPESNLDKSDVLVAALQEEDQELVLYSVKRLSHSRSPKAVVPLAHLFDTTTDEIRVEVLKTLEDIRDSRSIPVGRLAVRSANPAVICQGLHLLRALGTEKDARLAIRTLAHADTRVREFSCWNLSKERRTGAIKHLQHAMASDPIPSVRLAAAKALLVYEDVTTTKALLTTVSGDESLQVRMVAAFSLASHLSDKSTGVLLEALDSPEKALRRSAIDHLALRGSPAALKPLTQLLKEDKDLGLRCGAATALGHIGENSSVGILESHLGDETPLAYACAQALCRIWGVQRLDELARVLKEVELIPETLHVFASHMARLSHVTNLPDKLLQQARAWVVSTDVDLQFFGIDVLGRSGAYDDVDRVADKVPVRGWSDNIVAWPSLKRLIFRHGPLLRERLNEGWMPESPLFWTALSFGSLKISEVEAWSRMVVERSFQDASQPSPQGEQQDVSPVGVPLEPVTQVKEDDLIWPEDVIPVDSEQESQEPTDDEESTEERIDIGGLDVVMEVRESGASRSSMEFDDAEASSIPAPSGLPTMMGVLDRGSLRPLATLLRWSRLHGTLVPTLSDEGALTPLQSADALRRISRSRILSSVEKRLLGSLLSRTEGDVLNLVLQVVQKSPAPEALGPLLDLSIKQSHEGAREALGLMLGGAHGV